MVKVIGVRFKTAGKVYYFDPGELELQTGANVIVETARGMEFGTVTMEPMLVPEEDIVAPLKRIVRVACEEDYRQHQENVKKKEKAMALCQEKIDKHGLVMKLIDVEYTFDKSKIIFYFTADGRVDFREQAYSKCASNSGRSACATKPKCWAGSEAAGAACAAIAGWRILSLCRSRWRRCRIFL